MNEIESNSAMEPATKKLIARPSHPIETPEDILEGKEEIRYLRLLWQRKFFIGFFVLIFIGLAVFQLKRAVPVYTSSAVLKFEPSDSQTLDLGERSRMVYQRDEIRTAVELLKTPQVGEAVLVAIGDNQISDTESDAKSPVESVQQSVASILRSLRYSLVSFRPGEADEERLSRQNRVNSLLGSVYARTRPDTKLIELYVSRTDRMDATRLCEEFCNQFILFLQTEKLNSFSEMRKILDQQIQETKVRLENAEVAVFEYSGDSDIRIQEESRALAIEQLTALSRRMQEAESEVINVQTDFNRVDVLAQNEIALGKVPQVVPLLEAKSELESRAAMMRAENNDEFVPLQRIQQQIVGLEEQITEAIDLYKVTLTKSKKSELESVQIKRDAIAQQLAKHQKMLDGLEQNMIQFRVLQREVDSTRQVFNALLDQYQRLEVLDDIRPNNVTIVSPASIPTFPSSPNVTRTLMTFTLIGFFVGAGLVLLINWMDRSVKSPEIVEKKLMLPSLVVLPFLKKGGNRLSFGARRTKQPVLLAMDKEERNRHGMEAFRYLRTSINYSHFENKNRVILVTSSLPQEGKSTVSSNLAAFYAEQGEKVLLIDADLRRPSVHRIFEVNRSPGVSDVLTNQGGFEECIVKTSIENVDVLSAGMSTPSPTSLLESNAMKKMLATARSQYTMVIVDCSPSEGMADSLVLATQVDGVVLVVKQGSTPLDALARITFKMRSVGGNILGVVYNNAHQSPLSEGYGYSYNYYYSQRET